jgi:hypothetical protein
MSYWMFRPEAGFSQSLEWLTDVIRSKTSEQRIALRALPRVQYNFKHLVDRKSYQIAKSILLTDVYCKVPDWALRYTVTVGNGTNVVVTIGPNVFVVGDEVVLWTSDLVFQVTTVTSTTSTSVTLATVTISGSYILMKIVDANVSGGLTGSVTRDTFSNLTMNAILRSTMNYGTYTPSLYRSKPLYPFTAIIQDSLSEKIVWQVETIDNDLGQFDVLKLRTKADSMVSIRSLLNTVQTLDVFKWFQTMLGRQQEFYASSGYADFHITQSYASGASTIRVYGYHQILDFDDLRITFVDGTFTNYDVVSVAAGPLTNGEYTTDIQLGTTLGRDIDPSQAIKISKLYLLRQDTDRIEINHGVEGGDLIGISIPCMALS